MKWTDQTKTVRLPSGLTAKIRKMPTTAFLRLLDLGEVAMQKPSEVAKILIPSCLVEPRIESLDDLAPADVLALIDEIVKFSELDKIPFRTEEPESPTGSLSHSLRNTP